MSKKKKHFGVWATVSKRWFEWSTINEPNEWEKRMSKGRQEAMQGLHWNRDLSSEWKSIDDRVRSSRWWTNAWIAMTSMDRNDRHVVLESILDVWVMRSTASQECRSVVVDCWTTMILCPNAKTLDRCEVAESLDAFRTKQTKKLRMGSSPFVESVHQIQKLFQWSADRFKATKCKANDCNQR